MLFCNVNNLSPCGGYQYLHYKMIEVMYDDGHGDDDGDDDGEGDAPQEDCPPSNRKRLFC